MKCRGAKKKESGVYSESFKTFVVSQTQDVEKGGVVNALLLSFETSRLLLLFYISIIIIL